MKPKRITARERELLAELLYAARRLNDAADFARGGSKTTEQSFRGDAELLFDVIQEALGEPRAFSR